MQEINIQELFSVLGIGIFSIILFLYFKFIVSSLLIPLLKVRRLRKQGKNIPQFHLRKASMFAVKTSDSLAGNGLVVVYLILLYGLGLIVENVTQDISNTAFIRASFAKSVFQLKYDIRKEALLKHGKPTPLGKKVLACSQLMMQANNVCNTQYNCSQIIQLDKVPTELENDKNFEQFVAETFYIAKNWIYLYTTNAHDELKAIQDRIDFTRAICVLAFFSLIPFLMIFAVCFLILVRYRRIRSIILLRTDFTTHFILNVITLVLIWYTARSAYLENSSGYTKRVYGYYMDHCVLGNESAEDYK